MDSGAYWLLAFLSLVLCMFIPQLHRIKAREAAARELRKATGEEKVEPLLMLMLVLVLVLLARLLTFLSRRTA